MLLAIAMLLMAQLSPDWIARAAGHIREKRFDAAIQELSQAARQEPRSSLVHLLLGQAYLSKGTAAFVAQAKAEFQEARDLDDTQVLASFYIAKIDLDLGRIRQAERELERALEKKPGEHFLLALLGETRRQQGDPDGAIQLTTQAIESTAEALPVHYYRALAWWDRKNEKRALEDLAKILPTAAATADAYLLAGAIHLDRQRLREAEANVRQAIEMEDGRAEAHLRLAQVLRRQRRFDLARRELARVEAAPKLTSPYFQRLLADAACEQGLILLDEGNAGAARAWFVRALEIDPEHAEARRRLKP